MPSCRVANSSILPDVNRWMADSFSRGFAFWLTYDIGSLAPCRLIAPSQSFCQVYEAHTRSTYSA